MTGPSVECMEILIASVLIAVAENRALSAYAIECRDTFVTKYLAIFSDMFVYTYPQLNVFDQFVKRLITGIPDSCGQRFAKLHGAFCKMTRTYGRSSLPRNTRPSRSTAAATSIADEQFGLLEPGDRDELKKLMLDGEAAAAKSAQMRKIVVMVALELNPAMTCDQFMKKLNTMSALTLCDTTQFMSQFYKTTDTHPPKPPRGHAKQAKFCEHWLLWLPSHDQ